MDNTPGQIASDLAGAVRGDVCDDIMHRVAYSTDASIYRTVPLCVVAPGNRDDVAAVVKYARCRGIPIAARGAGTGLAGESLSGGIVFDMTRYMNRIIGVDGDGQTVVCEPGTVLSDLNNYLARFGRKIGPDPSSANRATVGGCIANNSTGAHSLQYGYIADYVEAVEAVLADGSVVEFGNGCNPEQIEDVRVASIARDCLSLLSENEAIIREAQPESKRNRSGYNIASVCHDDKIDLARLLAGSEGTLAVFTKLTLRTVAVPAAKALLQLEFDSLEKMALAVPTIVDSGVTTCELMDGTLINLAFDALPEYRDILPTGAAAVLLLEHVGQTPDEVSEKIEITNAAVGNMASGRRIFSDPEQQKRLWKARKDAGPLLYRNRSTKHPAEFMEDVSVDHNRLADYISGLQTIGRKYDFAMSFFGHAGDGELHMRPYLDLTDAADVARMQAIANDVFSLAWSLGGSISGEHADGLVRAAFVRQQYGDEYYSLLRRIKNIFDPEGLMNPGKILNDHPDVMIKNLRRAHRIEPERTESSLFFESNELALEIEQCYGCGLCLSREPDMRMCPVFRALGEELGSPRAKAGILQFWATGQLAEKDFESPQFRKFLDLCINCKACLQQCPSGVDISSLMIAARTEYVKRKSLRRTERMLSSNRYLSMFGSIFSPLSDVVMRRPIAMNLLERFAGIDRRRKMPTFRRGSFLKAGRKLLNSYEPVKEPTDKVAYFVDTYVNYNDHELGFAVLKILRHNKVEVILPEQLPAPLPAIVYGDVKRARKDLSYNVKHLAAAVREGYKIICSEPSAALCLKQELRHFVAGEDARLVSENVYELCNYLLDLFIRNKLKAPSGLIEGRFAYHRPCHLQASAAPQLLRELCGDEVVDLEAGCCGLAGTFGMQEKNYDLSARISESLKTALETASIKNVLTECAACKMQIEHISNCLVTHPAKILADSYS